MKTNKMLNKLIGLGALAFGLGWTSTAAATTNGIIVIMDQTGSMGDPTTINGVTQAKYLFARPDAAQFVNSSAPDRQWSIWTFQDLGSGIDPTQLLTYATDAQTNGGQRQALINGLPLPNGTTPLAHTLCGAVQNLIDWTMAHGYLPTTEKRIKLYSDGLENDTPTGDECYGPSSATNYDEMQNATQGGPDTTERGGLEVNSWQWKVLNKAITGNANSTAAPPQPLHVIFDVTALFDYIPTQALRSLHQQRKETSASGLSFYSTLSDSDASFFKALAKVTGGQYVQIDPATPPPVFADVSGDRCVGYADYYSILSAYGTVTAATQAADLNRDGKVDYYDILIVIQHWGIPC